MEEHLHYTALKDRKPSLNPKTACVPTSTELFIGEKGLLEDETEPRVEDLRVAPPYCRGNAAIAAFSRLYQGLGSLVFGEWFLSLLGPSWYTPFRVFSSVYSSDVRKGLGSMYLLEDPLLGLQELRI